MSDGIILTQNVAVMNLCREDCETYVTSEHHIYTCNPESTRLPAILTEVRKLIGGAEPSLELRSRAHVEQVLATSRTGKDDKRDDEARKGVTAERLTRLLQESVEQDASDVHIWIEHHETIIKYRIDGSLHQVGAGHSRDYGVELANFIFNSACSNADDNNFSLAIDNGGSFTQRLNAAEESKAFDFRASYIPTEAGNGIMGGKIVLRRLTPVQSRTPRLEELGIYPDQIAVLVKAIRQPLGGIMFSGQTGSGKTTTAMALLTQLPDDINLHTLEDPPEWLLPSVGQTRIDYTKTREGDLRDFAYYGKVMLRQDPDVIYFGEVRDEAAAAAFTHLCESGHLLVATTHTSSACGVATKLISHLKIPGVVAAGPEMFLLFTNQRLVPKLCQCALTYKDASSSQAMTDKVTHARRLFSEEELKTIRFRNPEPCSSCHHRGERGQTLVMELIEITDVDREFIASGNALTWRQHLDNDTERGWQSLREVARRKIIDGTIDLETAARHIRGIL